MTALDNMQLLPDNVAPHNREWMQFILTLPWGPNALVLVQHVKLEKKIFI